MSKAAPALEYIPRAPVWAKELMEVKLDKRHLCNLGCVCCCYYSESEERHIGVRNGSEAAAI